VSKLTTIFEDYLKDIEQFDEKVILGSTDRALQVKESTPGYSPKRADSFDKRTKSLEERLKDRFKFNNGIILLAIIILCMIFAIGVFFVFYYRNSPAALGGVFGGTFLSLLSIISWLHKLWREKSIMDMTLSVIEGLPAREAAKFINTMAWKLRGKN